MFNNCNPKTNGEYTFYLRIKDKINTIFDVGCREDSEFTMFGGEVHYFEPVKSFIDSLKSQYNVNKVSYFNNFGLGNENIEKYYYPRYQSFIDRINTCKVSDEPNKILLKIQNASDYIVQNNIQTIDFLKIDTEGYEFDVLKGFGDLLVRVNIIQFEYGGTYIDNQIKLKEVIDYLQKHGFYKFAYLTNDMPVIITDFEDHYNYCNIVCINENSKFVPY